MSLVKKSNLGNFLLGNQSGLDLRPKKLKMYLDVKKGGKQKDRSQSTLVSKKEKKCNKMSFFMIGGCMITTQLQTLSCFHEIVEFRLLKSLYLLFLFGKRTIPCCSFQINTDTEKGYFLTVFSSTLNSLDLSDTNATKTLNSDVIITCKYVKDMCSRIYKLYS